MLRNVRSTRENKVTKRREIEKKTHTHSVDRWELHNRCGKKFWFSNLIKQLHEKKKMSFVNERRMVFDDVELKSICWISYFIKPATEHCPCFTEKIWHTIFIR